ncbi:MAG: hypothetical protein RL033_7726 [Pseudomonadota bacterium]
MKHDGEDELQQALAAARAGSAPSWTERERLTEQLRARLGAAVVDGVLSPLVPPTEDATPPLLTAGATSLAPRPAPVLPPAQASRLGAILSSGLLMGALGLLAGYQLGLHAEPRAGDARGPEESLKASSAVAPILPVSPPELAPPELAPSEPAPPEPAPRPTFERLPRLAAERAKSNVTQAPTLGFAEVVERLRKANLALREGRPSLALLQLAELDRGAGGALREEREVTRLLARCALGDSAGARSSLHLLGGAAEQSIYAQRLRNSCVGSPR